jgi:PhzF family phenazine biosynthesis protein
MPPVDRDVVWTTVFPDGPGGGNPCPVVFGADAARDDELQAAAAAFRHETAFVLAPRAGGDARLRYFVPAHEMDMCVHATVAAVVLLAQRGRLREGGPARIETPLAVREVAWDLASSSATVGLPATSAGPTVTDAAPLLAALGVTEADVAGPIEVASVARPKVLVGLRDAACVDAPTPDVQRLWAICEDLEATGVYAFAAGPDAGTVAARQFPVRAGYDEDAATGVAAAALAGRLAAAGPGRARPAGASGRSSRVARWGVRRG